MMKEDENCMLIIRRRDDNILKESFYKNEILLEVDGVLRIL